MKRFLKYGLLFMFGVLLIGCSRSTERAERTLNLVQDSVTGIIDVISDIQKHERDLQKQFDELIHSTNELKAFSNEDNPLYHNIQERQALIDKLLSHNKTLKELESEIQTQLKRHELPEDKLQSILSQTNQLVEDINVYADDYKVNLKHEQALYHSIGNEHIDYKGFFDVFNNISIITTNNQMNLEKIIELFEPINTQLINLKIYLSDMREESKK